MNLDVGSSCQSQALYPSQLGEYEEICSSNDRKIYGHVDASSISYLFYLEQQEKWVLSPQIGDEYAWIGKSTKQYCPEQVVESEEWFTFTGEVD